MIKRLVLFCCLCLPALAVSAQEQEVKFAFDNYHRYYREARLCTDSAKLEAMKKLRVYFHEHPYRLSEGEYVRAARQVSGVAYAGGDILGYGRFGS